MPSPVNLKGAAVPRPPSSWTDGQAASRDVASSSSANSPPAPVDEVAKSGAKPSAPSCNEEDRSGSLNDETLVFPGSDLQPSGTFASQTLRAREQLTAVARALDAALMVRWSQQGVHVSVADGWARFFAEATRIVGSGMSVDEVESAVCGNLLSCSASSWVTQDDIRALFAFVQCGGSSNVTAQQWQLRVFKLELDAQSCSQLSEAAGTQEEEDSGTQPRRSFSASPASPERDQVEEAADSIEAPAAGTRMEATLADETDPQELPSSVAEEEAKEPATVTGQIVTTVAAADIAEDEGLVKIAPSAEDGAMADDVQCPATQHVEDEMNPRCDRDRSECKEEDGTMSHQKDSKDDPDELEAGLRDAEKNHSEKYSNLQTSADHSSRSGDQELDAMLAVAANRRLSPSKPALDHISDTIAVAARSAPAVSSSSTAASSSSSAASSSSGCVHSATGPVVKIEPSAVVRGVVPRPAASAAAAVKRETDDAPADDSSGGALLGHTLRPKELGSRVAVVGDGWGGGAGGYEAVVTEADDMTFTVVCVNGWAETHVLRSACIPVSNPADVAKALASSSATAPAAESSASAPSVRGRGAARSGTAAQKRSKESAKNAPAAKKPRQGRRHIEEAGA